MRHLFQLAGWVVLAMRVCAAENSIMELINTKRVDKLLAERNGNFSDHYFTPPYFDVSRMVYSDLI